MLLEPGPLTLPPPGRAGMPLPTHCRSRGFAPPQRLTVSMRCRSIASCCRSWGSSRFTCVPLLRTGQAGRRAHRHPRDAFRTPRRIPSPTAAPRHRGRCLLTVPPTSGHHPTAFAAGQGHRTPPPIRWALADRLLSRPPHITWGLLDDRSHRELPRHRSGPRCGRAPSPTLASRGGTRLDRESGPFQGLTPPTSSCFAHRIGYRRRQHCSSWASFRFKVLLPSPLRAGPTPPPPKREGASSSDPSSCRRVPCTL
jgi:hypothetical protein